MHLERTIEAGGLPDGMLDRLSRMGDICLHAEGLSGRFQAGLVVTDNGRIARINREQRGKDAATDVLSFPAAFYPKGTARNNMARLRRELDPETGRMHLGDIVISLDRAREQADAYGHSLTRELCFLFTHGMLHLMGYDHETEAERAAMRAMEDEIMEKAGLDRALTDADFALIEGAKEAMARAYAPYSKYPVGACVRAKDGRVFMGCNVENASFGMSICGERNAITTAVTEGAREIEAIAIAAVGALPTPCGACRQVMREFARDMRIILVCGEMAQVTSLQALLPLSFGPESLEEVGDA